MGSDRHKKENLLVQYRTGASAGKHVRALARMWKVTTNEAARRLMTLALLGLTKDDYHVIQPLEEGPGVDDFAAACGQVLVAVDVHEKMAAKPPGPEERLAFLKSWVTGFVRSHAAPEEPPPHAEAAPPAGEAPPAEAAPPVKPPEKPVVRRIRREVGQVEGGAT
jgi:hypothetical protein